MVDHPSTDLIWIKNRPRIDLALRSSAHRCGEAIDSTSAFIGDSLSMPNGSGRKRHATGTCGQSSISANLDLKPKNSFIRWCTDQGHPVFVISWVNPGAELAEKGFADYLLEGPLEALDAIERATGKAGILHRWHPDSLRALPI
jgi:hypothetical protein